jgi:hypothetical protein
MGKIMNTNKKNSGTGKGYISLSISDVQKELICQGVYLQKKPALWWSKTSLFDE